MYYFILKKRSEISINLCDFSKRVESYYTLTMHRQQFQKNMSLNQL